MKAAIGMTAGAVGAFVGTPAEISLIRMTSDGRLPVEQRRNYKSVIDALMRITQEEGVLTLWRVSAFHVLCMLGSHIHGKSGKVMEKFVVMESHGKVMENNKNIKSHGKVKILP